MCETEAYLREVGELDGEAQQLREVHELVLGAGRAGGGRARLAASRARRPRRGYTCGKNYVLNSFLLFKSVRS